MKEKRSRASAFVHGREIYVSGGGNGTKRLDSIESLNVDEEHLEWTSLVSRCQSSVRDTKWFVMKTVRF